MRQIILDTETTGLEPKQGHRIIEIGCIELINRRKTERNFHQYLNPERDIVDVSNNTALITLYCYSNQLIFWSFINFYRWGYSNNS